MPPPYLHAWRAESIGLIVPLGKWVFAEACRQAQSWRLSCLTDATESVIMEDVDTALACLEALKDLGLRLAVDDFGTG